jgi:hypothetical protein
MNNQIYQGSDGQTQIEVEFQQDTVWLSQEQLVELSHRDQSVISRHFRKIFKEGEVDEKSNMQKMLIPSSGKSVCRWQQKNCSSLLSSFLHSNDLLHNNEEISFSNDALASLTLFIASSKPEEMDTVKKLVISVLNRNRYEKR